MAAAATDVDLVDDLHDFDFHFDFDLDVIQALELELDMSLSADDEFRGGSDCYYSAIFSDADVVTHCRRNGCEDGDGGAAAARGWLLAGLHDNDDYGDWAEEEEEEAGSSPADSGVTDDDGPLTPAAGDDGDAGAMSAYVAELERFLMEDEDDAPCGEQAEVVDQGLLGGVVDDYFAGDQLLATADEVVPGVGRAEPTDGEEEENGDDVLAARQDDQSTSRKRARNKIKGTAMLTPWGELEVMNLMMMHLAQIQVPAAAAAAPWPPAPLCCM